jgi:hypothetical protein
VKIALLVLWIWNSNKIAILQKSILTISVLIVMAYLSLLTGSIPFLVGLVVYFNVNMPYVAQWKICLKGSQ